MCLIKMVILLFRTNYIIVQWYTNFMALFRTNQNVQFKKDLQEDCRPTETESAASDKEDVALKMLYMSQR